MRDESKEKGRWKRLWRGYGTRAWRGLWDDRIEEAADGGHMQ